MKHLFLFLSCFLVRTAAIAQPGALDPTFGNNGIVTLHPYFGVDLPKDMAITHEGKIMVLSIRYGEAHLLRFNADGSPDTSFGTLGNLEILQDEFVNAMSMAIDSLNRIVVLAQNDDTYIGGMYLYRLQPDGSTDVSFGNNGQINCSVHYAERGLLVQPGGQIVVAGQSLNSKIRISRYNSDGSNDLSFNSNGTISLNQLANSMAFGIQLQPDGKLLVTGSVDGDMFVARFTQDGEFDTSFSNDGYELIDNGKLEAGKDVSMTVDEKIIVSGHSEDSQASSTGCWRFQPDGIADSSFGTNGFVNVFTGTGNNLGAIVFANDDTTLIIGGSEFDGVSYKVILRKLLNSGSIDGGYGDAGMGGKPFVCGFVNELNAVRTADEKIILCGAAFDHGNIYSAVSVILADGHPDLSFGNGGTAMVTAVDAASQYAYCDVIDFAVLSSGKTLGLSTNLASDGPVLFRLNPDGSLDSTYDGTGWFIPYPYDETSNLEMLADSQRIYIVDNTGLRITDEYTLQLSQEVIVVKLHPDGTPDSTFGNSGIVHLPDTPFLYMKSAALQGDGKILMAQIFFDSISVKVRVARMDTDGTVDVSFANGGVKTFDWDANANYPEVAVRHDGKIVVQTSYYQGLQHYLKSALLNPDGTFDTGYGDNGITTVLLNQYGGGGINVQSDDKTLSLIPGFYPSYENKLLRLNQDGSVDSSFGINGFLSLGQTTYVPAFTQLDASDKIICTGNVSPDSLLVHRYLNNGTADSTFGTAGSVLIPNIIPLGTMEFERDYKIHFDSEGKILISGADFPDIMVCRLLNDLGTEINPVYSSTLHVFPNPVSSELIVNYPFSANETAIITITDMTGKILREEKVNKGYDRYAMDVKKLAAGIYFLTVKTGGDATSVKVVKD